MSSAKIYRLPGAARERHKPERDGYESLLLWSGDSSSGGETQLGLLVATLVLAWLYLSGAAGVARHDLLYGALLAGVWAVVFYWDALLGSRLGPLLVRAVRLLGKVGGVAFLAAVYGIILGR